ncbi:MAG: RagB/SusD family nutrient uptake outer membrane protein [Barnesiella sp.]|nr:RagB/SusD family nutrient uptake outer membrane protein [Barnesiella sp.]
MKTFKYIAMMALSVMLAGSVTSCEDMLDTKSDDYVFDNDLNLDNANDSLFSVMGILSQQQRLAERYVLLGEVRGDLVQVPATADYSLQEIAQFNVSADNKYLSRADYYNVINNCNYAIARMDTSVTIHNNKVMMADYVGIRSVRAWTQLQVALNFGELTWYTDPITNVDDVDKDYPVLPFDAALDRILQDIEPYIGMDVPNFGNVGDYNSTQAFVRPTLIAADIHLYKNNYEMAAQLYYDYIDYYNLYITTGYANRWSSNTRTGITAGNFQAYKNEVISRIPFSSDVKDYRPNLINMTYSLVPQMVPAPHFMKQLEEASHYYADGENSILITGTFEGDLRGMAILADNRGDFAGAYGYTHVTDKQQDILITKYYNNGEDAGVSNPDNEMFDWRTVRHLRSVPVYRQPSLYLRYAEAVNRAGKPSIAFAVITNGLKQKVMDDSTLVNKWERNGEPYINFDNSKYENNQGTAMRGRGFGIRLSKSGYLIPELATLNDSIEWVENEILYEMAAETCFEGNRFFDLLRVSHHRPDHPALFVEKVSQRFDNPAAAAARLSNPDNWWIKK